MSFRRIIPCLDTTLDSSGKPVVVKGVEFEGLRYAGDPISLAKKYDRQGADEVIFLDITASVDKRRSMLNVVSELAREISVPLGVGGGISSIEDFEHAIEAGVAKVSVNTAAVRNPSLIRLASSRFGSFQTVVAIDCKSRNEGTEGKTLLTTADGESVWYEVVILGGLQPTGLDAVRWVEQVQDLGVGRSSLPARIVMGRRQVMTW